MDASCHAGDTFMRVTEDTVRKLGIWVSCHAYGWAMAHRNESWHSYEYVMSRRGHVYARDRGHGAQTRYLCRQSVFGTGHLAPWSHWGVLQCIAVCCYSVLQCSLYVAVYLSQSTLRPDLIEVCCSVLQCVAVCCYRVLQCSLYVAVYLTQGTLRPDLIEVCCSVLWCVAVCCSVLQCVAVCCSVLQCVAVCCSVL